MGFGSKKSSTPAAATPTFTPTQTQQAQPTTIDRAANSAEARDRAASPAQQTSLLAGATGADEEVKRRQATTLS